MSPETKTLVSVEMTAKDAELYKQFCQYYDVFKAMMEAGAFHTVNGEVTMNFNGDGLLMNIEKRTVLYQRRKALDNTF